jgi:hypothetical protein
MIVVPAGSPLTRRQRMTWVNIVSPGWFPTMGVPMVAGRDFDARDRAGAPPVVIVNRAFAQRFLQGQTLGSMVSHAGTGPARQAGAAPRVVGVVDDTIYQSLRAPMEPIMYYPLAQSDGLGTSVVISARAASARADTLAHSVAAAIAGEDPTAVLSIRTLEAQMAASLTQERLVATLAGFFGVLGLLLAALGLYGVTSAAVTARRARSAFAWRSARAPTAWSGWCWERRVAGRPRHRGRRGSLGMGGDVHAVAALRRAAEIR